MIGKWIKPKDNMPEVGKRVLLWIDGKAAESNVDFLVVGCYFPTDIEFIGEWEAGAFDYRNEFIKAWMELPCLKMDE